MANVYGAALSGVRTYQTYLAQKEERLLELQKDALSDDPLKLQKAQYEAATMVEFINQAKSVASLILKIIQPIN